MHIRIVSTGGAKKMCIQVDTWVSVAQAVISRHQKYLDADGNLSEHLL